MMTLATPIDNLVTFVVQRRSKLGLTQRDAAEAAGINPGTWANIETGRVTKAPSMETLGAMAEGLRVDADLLYRIIDGRIKDSGLLEELANQAGYVPLSAAAPKIVGLKRGSEISKPAAKVPKVAPLWAFIAEKRGGMSIHDLARIAKLDPSIFDSISVGYVPPERELGKIAAALGVTLDEIKAAAAPQQSGTVAPISGRDALSDLLVLKGPSEGLPYFGKVGCGEFIDLTGEPMGLRDVPLEMMEGEDPSVLSTLEAWGNSMNQAGILPGMTLLVRQQENAQSGDVVIASVPFQGTTCKRYAVRKDGAYLVAESSEQYPDIKIAEGIRINGVVLDAWAHKSFRRSR